MSKPDSQSTALKVLAIIGLIPMISVVATMMPRIAVAFSFSGFLYGVPLMLLLGANGLIIANKTKWFAALRYVYLIGTALSGLLSLSIFYGASANPDPTGRLVMITLGIVGLIGTAYIATMSYLLHRYRSTH